MTKPKPKDNNVVTYASLATKNILLRLVEAALRAVKRPFSNVLRFEELHACMTTAAATEHRMPMLLLRYRITRQSRRFITKRINN